MKPTSAAGSFGSRRSSAHASITAPSLKSLGAVALLFAASCGGSSSGGSASHTPGSIIAGANGLKLIVDDNQGGNAGNVHVRSVEWGRLVDVRDFDSLTQTSNQIFDQIVVRDDITTQGSFKLDQDPISGRQTLTILHPFGSANFDAALGQALHLQQVLSKSLDPAELPPFTALPRNCAAVITFDDLLSPSTITPDDLRMFTGYAPTIPFESRVIADVNHGDKVDFGGSGTPQVYTTRVIVDMTISQEEAAQSNPPQVPNSLGLPAATVVAKANVALRIPTKISAANSQFTVLRNLSGSTVAFTGNGPNDPLSPTLDVIRAMRSMGNTGVTGDPSNGFLVDDIPPSILGLQGVDISAIQDPGSTDPNDFLVDLGFATLTCAQTVQVGDLITLNNSRATATAISNPPINGVVSQAKFHLNAGSIAAAILAGGSGQYTTTWNPALGVPPACFVRITPDPLTPPVTNVSSHATISVSFSEPMDPASIQAFDTFTVTRTNNTGTALRNNVVGGIVPSIDVTSFTFQPGNATTAVPLTHTQGTSESYVFAVLGGTDGATDLAGNALQNGLPSVTFSLEPTQASQNTDGFVLKFDSIDEDVPVIGGVSVNFPTPEVRGQLLYDLSRGVVKPRPVTRFSGIVDDQNPIIGKSVKFTAPIQTPMSNLGSKMMTVWRYHDMGFSCIDESTMNIDVEEMSWSPFNDGGVIVDTFPQFQISLAHSHFLPDEDLDTALLPKWQNSGLVATFAANVGDAVNDPLYPIHPKDFGYVITPSDSFTSATGHVMHRWPVNLQMPAGTTALRHYTFRDTALQMLGAPNGQGADTGRYFTLLHGPPPAGPAQTYYKANNVPTVGLPLLMEFRCYPNDSSLGLNGFQIAIAINSSAAPFFRAFSTGGISTGGQAKKVDPDAENVAQGGISPATGQSTPPLDNSIYWGQADFVVRISRMHTIWFDSGSSNSSYFDPIVEPSDAAQPAGTQVVLAFRGASAISPAPGTSNGASYVNANNIDFYGDSKVASLGGANPFTVTFNPVNDKSWKSSLSAVNGSQFFQVRASFISNTDTGLAPELSALGFPFTK